MAREDVFQEIINQIELYEKKAGRYQNPKRTNDILMQGFATVLGLAKGALLINKNKSGFMEK